MKELLEFLLKGITGKEDVTVSESSEAERVDLTVSAPQDYMGMIIGKGGRTIKMIRSLLRVRATLEKKGVSIILPEGEKPSVAPKS